MGRNIGKKYWEEIRKEALEIKKRGDKHMKETHWKKHFGNKYWKKTQESKMGK